MALFILYVLRILFAYLILRKPPHTQGIALSGSICIYIAYIICVLNPIFFLPLRGIVVEVEVEIDIIIEFESDVAIQVEVEVKVEAELKLKLGSKLD